MNPGMRSANGSRRVAEAVLRVYEWVDLDAAAPDAAIVDASGALAVSLVWDHAVMDVATNTTPIASLNARMLFIKYSKCGLPNQKEWRMPIIAAVVDTPGATGAP